MTVYVIRDGELVEKGRHNTGVMFSDFPAPRISRIEPFESPVTGKEISSWRQRDADMAAAGAMDPRDLPAPTRGRGAQKREAADGQRAADDTFKWRDPA